MAYELIEFKNSSKETLRGLLQSSKKSDYGVIFLHGFERNGTAESKFKKLADSLYDQGIPTFRFDYRGCGISDGDFTPTSVNTMTDDFRSALKIFRSRLNLKECSVVAHSVSGCVIADYLKTETFSKIVLIGPATNQKDLMRYWFVINQNKDKEITWNNYKDFLDEDAFRKDCNIRLRPRKANMISSDYFLENMDQDYTGLLREHEDHILHIHGSNDLSVPIESLGKPFRNHVIVDGGDHDLERVESQKRWLKKAVLFLKRD